MKVSISINLNMNEDEMKEVKEYDPNFDFKKYLTDSLFEICEYWVIHGREPSLDFEED